MTAEIRIRRIKGHKRRLEFIYLFVRTRIIIRGEFNDRALEWGTPQPEIAVAVIVLSIVSTLTFRRPSRETIIRNVSFATESLVSTVERWRIL